MIKFYLILVSFIGFQSIIFSQKGNNSTVSLTFYSGANASLVSDRLINYYDYRGFSFKNLHSKIAFEKGFNLYSIYINCAKAELVPVSLPANLYEFNNLKIEKIGFYIKYSRKIEIANDHLNLYLGLANKAFYIKEFEHFKNLLYEYATIYRKSYDLTPINLVPEIDFTYKFKKNNILVMAGFSAISVHSRPSDNYVKQLGLVTPKSWNLFGPQKYSNYSIVVEYAYLLKETWRISASYQYQKQKFRDKSFDYQDQQLMLGVHKYFKK